MFCFANLVDGTELETFQKREAFSNQPHKMLLKQFLTTFRAILGKSAVYSSVPMSLLLFLLEVLIKQEFSCPCGYEGINWIITSIFVGPSLFTCALMFLLLRFCRSGSCGINKVEGYRLSFPDAFLQCLIPPFIWIVILFLDGDYVACGSTTWKGNYVFDEELNRMWCKPGQRARAGKESDLRQKYHVFIYKSKALGYAVITLLSLLIIIVGLYDCCCVIRHPKTQKALQGEEQQLKPLVPVLNLPTSEGCGLKEEDS